MPIHGEMALKDRLLFQVSQACKIIVDASV